MFRLLLLLSALASWTASAGTVMINGKTYQCSGSVSVSDDGAFCNGKKMSESGAEDAGPCGDSPTKKHENGGGQVDLRAHVPAEARVNGTVCGSATLEKSSIIQNGAIISGDFKVGKDTVIRKGATITGAGLIGDGVVIGEGATLSGNVHIVNSQISRGTTLSGNINIDGVNLTGHITCAGNGTISAAPPANAVH